jgi:hypothetical protein
MEKETMKLKKILQEIDELKHILIAEKYYTEKITFYKPNFEFEWEEAERYPKLFPDKSIWLDKASDGRVENVHCGMNLQNTDMCERGELKLSSEKVSRVKKEIKTGKVELPIFMKRDDTYELIGGNTRLVYLKRNNLPTKAWVFDYD